MYELAVEIGGMTVEEMQDRMSSREFTDWCIRANIIADERNRANKRRR